MHIWVKLYVGVGWDGWLGATEAVPIGVEALITDHTRVLPFPRSRTLLFTTHTVSALIHFSRIRKNLTVTISAPTQ